MVFGAGPPLWDGMENEFATFVPPYEQQLGKVVWTALAADMTQPLRLTLIITDYKGFSLTHCQAR